MPRRRITLLRQIAPRVPAFRGKARLFSPLLAGMGVERVQLSGLPMQLDLSDPFERMAAIGLYQPEILKVLRSQLAPGDCFADCGAHVGLISVPLAGHLGAGGFVYAFEPAEATYHRLADNFAGLADIPCGLEAVPLALGAAPGKADLLVSAQHGWSTMSPSAARVGSSRGQQITRVVKVDVGTLDEFFVHSGRRLPQAVKIDVEGWEEDVVKGGRQLFTSHPPRVVVLERNEGILAAMGRSWSTIERLMQEFGYIVTDELDFDVVFQPAMAQLRPAPKPG